MATVEARAPLQPGEPAPDFSLPAGDREGTISLADYRGRTPVLLAIMRGLYCAFCRRHIEQLGVSREKLQAVGVETLAVVATTPERARLYFRHRPTRVSLAADPQLVTHRSYGLPSRELTSEVSEAVESAYGRLARELQVPAAEIHSVLDRRDGFQLTATDQEDLQRQGAQSVGQILVDREGIVRWVNVEGAKEGPAGMGQFPTNEELLAAARTL